MYAFAASGCSFSSYTSLCWYCCIPSRYAKCWVGFYSLGICGHCIMMGPALWSTYVDLFVLHVLLPFWTTVHCSLSSLWFHWLILQLLAAPSSSLDVQTLMTSFQLGPHPLFLACILFLLMMVSSFLVAIGSHSVAFIIMSISSLVALSIDDWSFCYLCRTILLHASIVILPWGSPLIWCFPASTSNFLLQVFQSLPLPAQPMHISLQMQFSWSDANML